MSGFPSSSRITRMLRPVTPPTASAPVGSPLNRGTGDGNPTCENFWSHEKDAEGNGAAFAHQGATPTAPARWMRRVVRSTR